MSEIIFETERLIVRRYTPNDLDEFYSLNSDEEVMRYIRKPLSYNDTKDFLQKNLELYKQNPLLGRWAALDRNNTFVGSFAIIPIGETTDIQLGYALLKPYWGLGYATELAAGGVKYAIASNIDPLYAQAESANVNSQKVLLKNGFEYLRDEIENDKTLFRYKLKRP
jgi:[ribosomal protein S5]-alanine N-acetyltransferase